MKLGLKYKLTILVSLLLLSCQRNELVPTEVITDAITFSVSSNAGYSAATRAGGESLALISDDYTDSLQIQISDVSYSQDETITKGSPVTNNNLNLCTEEIAIKAFYKNEQFVDDVFVFDQNGGVRTSIACYWPIAENAQVDFWSFHPKEIAQAPQYSISNDPTKPYLSFYYNQKKTDEDILVDATEQKDMFMAYARQGKESGAVDLNYIHALSSVKFQAGKALSGTILNITISNVYAGGTLTYTPEESDKVTWDLDNEKICTLDQDFEKGIVEDFIGDMSQVINRDIDNTVFMLIPQTLADKTLTVTYRRDGEEQAKTYTAGIPGEKWEPGKSYTYIISLMDGLGVDVETTSPPSNTSVINRIQIENTHNKTCYIRAMIIANWVDEEGNVAAILNPDEVNLEIEGNNINYELSDDWENWFYDRNANIYYYKKPLTKTEPTADLFKEFTNPIRHSEGLKLDFVVLVQAVEATSVRTAWGDDIANNILEPVAGN